MRRSKRAFQLQFRRWHFPRKQKPAAHRNSRLVSRVGELWANNVCQRDMLRLLNDEEGFVIKARELSRLRIRNGWLVRAPNGDRGDDDEEDLDGVGERQGKEKVERKKTRFPSEMRLEDARRSLGLDIPSYRALRSHFQRICHEAGLSSKTQAGPEDWEAAKSRLEIVVDLPPCGPSERVALDVICTDVTKRLRSLEGRMSLTEARRVLGLDPERWRLLRVEFRRLYVGGGSRDG
ncbi:hypothetical protein CP532_4718 [Ophiocordyceps camponoti-leonardi (nom. inval.)]|nr:hypothetical protein CP532_4718 [Ophiocordyceps camponoti-leonardi (nom. inval.)]